LPPFEVMAVKPNFAWCPNTLKVIDGKYCF